MQKGKATHVHLPRIEDSDSILVQHVLGGDQQAFELLVNRYHPLLYRFVYHHLGEYDQTCDIVQHVFMQLYICLPRLITGDQLKPWLLRVAQNSCRDELRKRRRRRVTLFSALELHAEEDEISPLTTLPDNHPLPEEIAEQHELQRRINSAICALPCKFRAVVLLRYRYQYSFAEIGQVLNMPMTTAKTYYYRACAKLRIVLRSH